MKKHIPSIIAYLLSQQDKHYEEKRKRMLSSKGNGIKKIFTPHAHLEIKNKVLDEMREMVIQYVAPIVKENINTPEKILDYIEQNGTPVYKLKNPDKILTAIGEQEGFITPIKGLKAIYLNYTLKRKIAPYTDAMFIVKDSSTDIYTMAYQFFKWYGWKIQMPGYDDKTQNIFKKVWLFKDQKYTKELTYDELSNLKEAIERDKEAIDFVIKLARENKGAKRSFDNMLEGGADI